MTSRSLALMPKSKLHRIDPNQLNPAQRYESTHIPYNMYRVFDKCKM